MTDEAWAEREAAAMDEDATHYESLIRTYGRNPVWVQAMREDREASTRLRRLASQTKRRAHA